MRIILGALLLTLLACSKNELTYEQRDQAYQSFIEQHSLTSVNHINTFRYQGWQSLTPNFLIISTTLKRHYLLKLKSRCNELLFAQTLLMEQSQANILSARFDAVRAQIEQPYSCFIDTIYPLTNQQAEQISNIGKPVPNNKKES